MTSEKDISMSKETATSETASGSDCSIGIEGITLPSGNHQEDHGSPCSPRLTPTCTLGRDGDMAGVSTSTSIGANVGASALTDAATSASRKRRLEDESEAQPATSAVASNVLGPNKLSEYAANEDSPPRAKKPRLDSDASTSAIVPGSNPDAQQAATIATSQLVYVPVEPSEIFKPSPLLTLPLELLSEILILTGSSQYVLAVARTCKALCHTLLGKDTQFIWREARRGLGCSFEVPEIGTDPAGLGMAGGINTANVPGLNAVLFWLPVHPPPGVGLGAPAPVANPTAIAAAPKRVVSLPDLPKQFFSEASYAAFLFDSGLCECCGKETGMMYESFALRLRKCKSTICQKNGSLEMLESSVPIDQQLQKILPVNESNGCIPTQTDTVFWPSTETSMLVTYCRRDAKEAAWVEYMANMNDEDYKKKFSMLQKRRREWMEFCVELYKWKKVRQVCYYTNKSVNEKAAKAIASKYGWDHADLVNCTVFGPYQRLNTKIMETVNETDVAVMQDAIESQLLEVAEKRGRRSSEISLMENRKDVEALYNRLRSGKVYQFLPSLATFRQLPVISLLQLAEMRPTSSSSSRPNVADTLQSNPLMKQLLANQLKKWAESAKQDLGVILGFPRNWKNASKNVLHPVERVSARFLCRRCNRVDKKYSVDGCLDFAGACRHECGVGNEKKGRVRKGKKGAWDAEIFVKDEKAISVLKQCLRALGHAEDRDAGHYMLKVGIAALCTSCEPPMVIDTRNIIGHSHRHEDMQVTFASSVDKVSSYLGGYPYTFGLVRKLMDPGASFAVSTKREIDKKNFGCRHCLRTKQIADVAAAENNPDTEADAAAQPPAASGAPGDIELSTVVHYAHDLGFEGPRERPLPLFSFNGLRSHLKGKHRIEDIRDEDVFCYNAVPL